MYYFICVFFLSLYEITLTITRVLLEQIYLAVSRAYFLKGNVIALPPHSPTPHLNLAEPRQCPHSPTPTPDRLLSSFVNIPNTY